MAIPAFTYKPYTKVEVLKTNSTYGNYVVKTSEVSFTYFWKKIDAEKFASKINNQ